MSALSGLYLKNFVIIPTCQHLGMYTPVSTLLLLGTFAQESHFGKYRVQIGGGPGIGIGQTEPATALDTFRYIKSKPDLEDKIKSLNKNYTVENIDLIQTDDIFACIITRIKYWMVKAQIGDSTPENLAKYWKQFYNTPLGAGTPEDFVRNYNLLVAPIL